MEKLILSTINLSIFLAILFYYTKKPLKEFVKNRHETIRNLVQQARQEIAAAKADFDEYSAKLKAVDSQVTALKKEVRLEAEDVSRQIVSSAKERSSLIVGDSRASVQAQVEDLRNEIKREFAVKVFERAEEAVQQRLTGADRDRIRREFSSRVGSFS